MGIGGFRLFPDPRIIMETSFDRDKLQEMESRVLQEGSYFKPEIRLYSSDDERIVVKDILAMHPAIKLLMGRRTMRREKRVYERLDGLRGVPRYLGSLDADAFAMAFVEGDTLHRGMGAERLVPALKDLESVLAGIHGRRVVHLDLKQKRNVLVDSDNHVSVLDFQSAFCFGDHIGGRMLFAFLRKRDLAGIIKFRGRYIPETLTPSELKSYKFDQRLARLWPFTHLVRMLRKLFNSPSER